MSSGSTPSKERFSAHHIHAGLEARNHEPPVVVEGEVPDKVAGAQVERNHVGAKQTLAVAGDAALDASCDPPEVRRWVNVGNARNVIGVQWPFRDVARREPDWKHDGRRGNQPATTRGETLGLAHG